MAEPILELRHVSHTFSVRRGLFGRRALRAVDDVSVRLARAIATPTLSIQIEFLLHHS